MDLLLFLKILNILYICILFRLSLSFKFLYKIFYNSTKYLFKILLKYSVKLFKLIFLFSNKKKKYL